MRRKLLAIFVVTLALTACKKFDGADLTLTAKTPGPARVSADTVADHAIIKIRIAKDSDNCGAYDALYFPGFGKASLSTRSRDDKAMAIYTLPY